MPDPYADRRLEEDRRHDGSWAVILKVLGSPVSIIVLLGSIVLGTISVVERANNALPSDVYATHRFEDSTAAFYKDQAHNAEHKQFELEIENMRLTQNATNAKLDTIVRFMRRSVCRTQPDLCP